MQTTITTRTNGHAASKPRHMAAVEVEEQLLGCVLELIDTDASKASAVVESVRPAMLTDPVCRDVAAAVAAAFKQHDQPTRHDVLAAIRRMGDGSEQAKQCVFGLAAEWAGMGPQAGRLADEAARELLELHYRQTAYDVLANVQKGLRDGTATTADLTRVTDELQLLAAAKTDAAGNKPLTFLDCCEEWGKHERSPVVPTGLRPFDTATQGGLPQGALTGFVAPPGGRKSAFALQLVLGAVHADCDLRAVYGLGEMSPAEIAQRYACVGSFVYDLPPVTMLQASRRDRKARDVLVEVANDIGERLTFVRPPLTVAAMRAEVERTNAKLLVVDYLQLTRGEGSTQVEQLDGIVDELQRLAVELEVAVVLISSMAKAAGQRTGAHEWGRGSGQIGYTLSLLYVAEIDKHEDTDGTVGIRWACKKARSIRPADIELRFDGSCQTFTPAERPVEAFADHAPAEGGW